VEGVQWSAGSRPDSIVLKFLAADTPGALLVPVPESARDWTPYATFTFEFASSSTISYQLQIRNRKGEVFTYRVHPYQGLPVRAAIPISFLTREYMNNRQFKGYFLGNWGNHIDMTQVEALAIRMQPNHEVTLQLGPLALVREQVPDELRNDAPVVDEFGQWAGLDWPGKVRSLPELKRA